MKNNVIKALKYYLLSGAMEGALALAILFILPTDAKNIWVLGFSKARLALAIGLLGITLVLGWLGLSFGKREWHLHVANSVARLTGNYPVFGPVMLFGYGLAIFLPYWIVTYPVIPTLQGIQIRIFPVMFFLLTRLVQASLIWRIIARQVLQLPPTLENEISPIQIDPQKVAVILSSLAGLFILTSATLDFIDTYIGIQQFEGFRLKFDLDQEANIPTYFSSIILFLSAVFLSVISIRKKQAKMAFARHWQGLAGVFFFISLDEASALHEKLINIVRGWLHPTGFFYYGWVIIAIPVVLILALIYLQFFFNLPSKTRTGFFLSGFLYVMGALGMEMIGAWFARTYGENNRSDNLLITIEESLEMFAIILFVHTLIVYLEDNFPDLNFKVFSSTKRVERSST